MIFVGSLDCRLFFPSGGRNISYGAMCEGFILLLLQNIGYVVNYIVELRT